jgi:hypothetical protein
VPSLPLISTGESAARAVPAQRPATINIPKQRPIVELLELVADNTIDAALSIANNHCSFAVQETAQ